MPYFFSQPVFVQTFPDYTSYLQSEPSEPGCLQLSGQIESKFYCAHKHLRLGQSLIHQIGQREQPESLGVFHESYHRPLQSTMTLNVTHYPQNPDQAFRFHLLVFLYLLCHLKYPPSDIHPIILRGKTADHAPSFSQLAILLGFDKNIVSNRTQHYLGFHAPNILSTPQNYPESIEAFKLLVHNQHFKSDVADVATERYLP